MKNHFKGKYFKFISEDGFSFAIILSNSNDGNQIQLITKEDSYLITDTRQVKTDLESFFEIDIVQDNLVLKGKLFLGKLNPLKKKVMGPFSYIPFMECKHNIYSMYHDVKGKVECNGSIHEFNKGIGYIEGDKGVNFPKKYIWYNSVTKNNTLTLAIASIPFGLFTFTGVLCFMKSRNKEYYFCTWNRVRIIKIDKYYLELKKGKYTLKIELPEVAGHNLSAPVKGNMNRFIKENLSILSSYTLLYKNEVVLEEKDPYSSCEWMWD